MIEYIARQIELGGFGDHHGEFAKTVTAQQFAEHFGVEVHEGAQYCVTVEGIDYYWSTRTGIYDGRGRGVRAVGVDRSEGSQGKIPEMLGGLKELQVGAIA